MASTDARPVPQKNTAYRLYLPLRSSAGVLVSGATTPDTEVSIDGGTFSDATNEVTEIATSSGIYYIDLTAAEMNGDAVVVQVKSADIVTAVVTLYPEEAGDIEVNVVQIEGSDPTDQINAAADTAISDAALATSAALATVDSNVDAILVDTAEIGAAGAGLTAVPWNAAWDAEVQSEVTDGLNAYDPPTKAELDSGLAALNDPTAAAIADAVLDEALAGHATAGTLGKAVTDIETDATAILADTNELQTDDIPGTLATLATSAALATVDSNVDAILVDTGTDLPAQINSIGASSGGALNFANSSDNIDGALKSVTFVGVETSGTNLSVNAEDGTYHQIDDTGDAIDLVYEFNIGGGRSAASVLFKGYLSGSNDTITVQAYNGSGWDTVKSLTGQAGSTNVTEDIPLLTTHTGTGADIGKVYIRFVCSGQSNPTLYIDQLIVQGVSLGQTVGYVDGAIWIDTNNGTAGTESFVNGTADNPVDSLADALTLSSGLGLKRFHLATGSSITLTANSDTYDLEGTGWTLALSGQSINGAVITGATISGTFSGTPTFEDCIVNAITGPGATLSSCYFNDVTITNNGTDGWFFNDCRSRVAGTASANFDFGAAAGSTSLNLRSYSGGIEIENMGQVGTDVASIELDGQITLNANCAGGTLAARGTFNFTDNSSGAVSLVLSSPVSDYKHQGTAQGGTANTITLSATASSTDNEYDPGAILIIAGPGKGESRGIIEYDGTTKVAVVDKDWRTNPTSSSSYIITSAVPLGHVNEGLVTGGSSTTVTLNAASSSTDDIYIGQTVFLVAGTGQDQARVVTDYNGTTKVATVHKAWDINPSTDTSYLLLPTPVLGDTIIDILADTNELQTDDIPGTLSTIQGLVTTVDTVVDGIKAVTDNLPESGALTTLTSNITAILADTNELQTDDVPGLIAALNDITAASVLAAGDIDGYSLEEFCKLAGAVLLGKIADGGTATNTFRAIDDSKDRVTATVSTDGAGNRSAVVLDASG